MCVDEVPFSIWDVPVCITFFINGFVFFIFAFRVTFIIGLPLSGLAFAILGLWLSFACGFYFCDAIAFLAHVIFP